MFFLSIYRQQQASLPPQSTVPKSSQKKPRRKSQARNRQSFSSEGVVSYMLQKERTPSPKPSPRPAKGDLASTPPPRSGKPSLYWGRGIE